jgi:prepilin-type N-terminal cleavage/methylation domain-containing protein
MIFPFGSIRPGTPAARREPPGFTLMELIVVMTIISLMTAAVVPIYQGTLTWTRNDRALSQVVSLMKYAQERAVTDSVSYRFYLDDEAGTFWLSRQGTDKDGDAVFVRIVDSLTGLHRLPEGLSFKRPSARHDKSASAYYVTFHPSGACDYATIKLAKADRSTITIKTKGKLGQFEVEGE